MVFLWFSYGFPMAFQLRLDGLEGGHIKEVFGVDDVIIRLRFKKGRNRGHFMGVLMGCLW